MREIGDEYGGGKVADVVLGGDTRQESVWCGLKAIDAQTVKSIHNHASSIVVHDAARCCVTPKLITRNLLQLGSEMLVEAVTAAIPVSDTVVRSVGSRTYDEVIPRDPLYLIQTPQVFTATTLGSAHYVARESGAQFTDDAGLVAATFGDAGIKVRLGVGSIENIKVTRPEDLGLAAAILARRSSTRPPIPPAPFPPPKGEKGGVSGSVVVGLPAKPSFLGERTPPFSPFGEGKGAGGIGGNTGGFPFRVGHGYDVHQLVPGRELWLGGVHFPESALGLLGHSDADALLHAVCDALLGAAGLGDIGVLFPPSDMAHKNRRSIEFLAEVKARLEDAGWRVGNVDISVLAETPKIMPRAGTIRETIAVVLGISADAVSVKATTSESMGFVGRGEGIAVHATALIYR